MPGTSTVVSSQGATCSWNGPLGKVVSVSGTFASPIKEIRELANNLDDGERYLSIYEKTVCEQTVEVEVIVSSSSTLSDTSVGTVHALSIAGEGWSMNFPYAILEKFVINAKVADVVRVSLSFKRSFA